MSIGFDPIVSSALFSANLIPHAFRPKAARELPGDRRATPPFVTVIVALYREGWEDIEMTLASLLRQTMKPDRFEVLWAVEARDPETHLLAAEAAGRLRAADISSRLVVSNGGTRLKAYALNRAIEHARGEICAFYDASDDIDPRQVEDAALLMQEKQYDAVQATVLRKGASILSRFLFIDTAFWFRRYIPFVLGLADGMPLSGEGLFLKTSVLRDVGGFPEVLTEDGYLGIMLTERNMRFGLLASTVTEKAPKNIRSHFVQRLRWNRGYLTCLARLFRGDLSLQAQARVVSALPDAAQLLARVRRLDADSRPVGGVRRRRVEHSRRRAVAAPASGLHERDVLLGARTLRGWHSTLHRLVCPDPAIARHEPGGTARSAAAVLLELYRFAATCSFFKDTDALGKNGAVTEFCEAKRSSRNRVVYFLIDEYRLRMGMSDTDP
jgi:hypothetical protein